jgi:hypothetical protein
MKVFVNPHVNVCNKYMKDFTVGIGQGIKLFRSYMLKSLRNAVEGHDEGITSVTMMLQPLQATAVAYNDVLDALLHTTSHHSNHNILTYANYKMVANLRWMLRDSYTTVTNYSLVAGVRVILLPLTCVLSLRPPQPFYTDRPCNHTFKSITRNICTRNSPGTRFLLPDRSFFNFSLLFWRYKVNNDHFFQFDLFRELPDSV